GTQVVGVALERRRHGLRSLLDRAAAPEQQAVGEMQAGRVGVLLHRPGEDAKCLLGLAAIPEGLGVSDGSRGARAVAGAEALERRPRLLPLPVAPVHPGEVNDGLGRELSVAARGAEALARPAVVAELEKCDALQDAKLALVRCRRHFGCLGKLVAREQ